MINIMNDSDIELYKKYKIVVQGLYTIDDFNNMIDQHNLGKNDIVKNTLLSFFKSKNISTHNKIGLFAMYQLLKTSSTCEYHEDVMDKYSGTIKKIKDNFQANTITRLLRTKTNKPYDIIVKEPKLYMKECPHCSSEYVTSDKDKEYVVCGYEDGYDWRGCRKDWCFKCGKKLCKIWDIDNLYIMFNRYHNNKCCLNHAKKNGFDYEKDYCHCAGSNVDRKKK
jgi:hypothetical protein